MKKWRGESDMKKIEYKVDFVGVCLTKCLYYSCKVGSNTCLTCDYFGGKVIFEKERNKEGRGIIKCKK